MTIRKFKKGKEEVWLGEEVIKDAIYYYAVEHKVMDTSKFDIKLVNEDGKIKAILKK